MSYSIFLIQKHNGQKCDEYWTGGGYSINEVFKLVARWNATDNRKYEVRCSTK